MGFLLLMMLLLLPAARADDLTLVQTEAGLSYAFALPEDEFALLQYKTPQESGALVLHGPDGQFSGEIVLRSQSGGRAEMTVSTLMQRRKFSAKIDLLPAPEYRPPEGASHAAVKDLVLTETPEGLDYAFTAPGADYMLLNVHSRQESFVLPVASIDAEGHFTGSLTLPLTYARTLVTLKVQEGSGRTMAEMQARKGYAAPPAPDAQPGRLSGVTVCIDPGHQENSQPFTEPCGPGLRGSKTGVMGMAQGKATQRKEAIVVLEIGMLLRDELLRQGATVVMTREAQEPFHTNLERCQIAADAGADVMLRLHCDLRQNANTRGLSVFAPLNSDYARAVAAPANYRAMGELLLDAVKRAAGYELGSQTGGVTLNDQYTGNNWAQMPCFLIELGYMSNLQEDYLLSAPIYQQRLAEGMAQGIYDIALFRGLVTEE